MGPPPRNCCQSVFLSLVAGEARLLRSVRTVWIDPDPGFLGVARSLLREAGLGDPQDLRSLPGLPTGRLICRDVPRPEGVVQGEPLLAAAILGLCNAHFYSPARPIVWTEARLGRCVELISTEEFYAR